MTTSSAAEPQITPAIWREMGLSDSEYAEVEKVLGRKPTYTELGMYAVMWSEHCGYKYSRPVLRLFKRYREQLDSGALENAGIVNIGGGLGIAMKIESHNHPSAVEPFQGAATGVGGILRDIFTMGARPIASLNSLRFGDLSDPHVRYLFEHVVAGIGFYGNCVGVPTVGGEVFFDPCYAGNPLVNAMSLGLVELDRVASAKAAGPGNPVLVVGSRTGRDGIHGATFASVELGPDSESKRPNVQMGDPFTEKLLIEATLEALDTGAVVGIQDMGAAGITCSTCETSAKAGTGMEIDVALVPQREEGMTPYEIMLSESQERMLVIAEKGREDEVAAVFKKWGLNAVVVGKVTSDGLVRVKHHGEVVAEVPAASLADDCPTYQLEADEPAYISQVRSRDAADLTVADASNTLMLLLARPNIASKQWVYRQYDHMVQTNTAVFPGSDAGVLRIRGVKTGVAVTADCNARKVFLDPYVGSKLAVYEAATNLACSGAKPSAVTDCLNFGNPEKPEAFWQFKESVRGLADACEELGTPVISGNVSFYNETPDSTIYPTPVIGMLGVLEDVDRRCQSAFASDNSAVIVISAAAGDRLPAWLAGSELQSMLHEQVYGSLPALEENKLQALQSLLISLVEQGKLRSAHDVAEGGIAVCIAESAVLGEVGCEVDLGALIKREVDLFSETPGVAVVSTGLEDAADVVAAAEAAGLIALAAGNTGGSSIRIALSGATAVDVALDAAADAYFNSLGNTMERKA